MSSGITMIRTSLAAVSEFTRARARINADISDRGSWLVQSCSKPFLSQHTGVSGFALTCGGCSSGAECAQECQGPLQEGCLACCLFDKSSCFELRLWCFPQGRVRSITTVAYFTTATAAGCMLLPPQLLKLLLLLITALVTYFLTT